MKARLALVSLSLGAFATGGAWVAAAPIVGRALDVLRVNPHNHLLVARIETSSIVALSLVLIVMTIVVYLVLGFVVARVLELASGSVARFAAGDRAVADEVEGPLGRRFAQTLRRLQATVDDERRTSSAQVESLRRVNDELRRLQSELVASDRLATVGKLASGVAHEVGNPLSGLSGYLSILKGKLEDRPDLKDLATRADEEVQRIDGIVRALLELGRPSRGDADFVDVRGLIESTVRLIGASPPMRDVAMEITGGLSRSPRAESGPLAQVLVNLLLNAGQAMGGKGRVRIELAEAGGRALIRVIDEGPGIPPEVMPRLFELFFTTKAPGKGTGLGLAVSRHLLGQFGGDLSVANGPTGGAVFTIGLPLPA